MSAVTRPWRTALSIALNAGIGLAVDVDQLADVQLGAVRADVDEAVADAASPTHTFASKNQNER